VKQHESQPIGTVMRLDPSGEFGFLESSDGREIYFHRNSVLDAFPSDRGLSGDLCRGNGREGTAGQHSEVAWETQAANMIRSAPSAESKAR
jgi:hypothetical protein